VTGVGAVSPVGLGNEFWDSLVAGKSGIGRLPSWADEYPAKVRPFPHCSRPHLPRNGRALLCLDLFLGPVSTIVPSTI
jgi:hypothetical protein